MGLANTTVVVFAIASYPFSNHTPTYNIHLSIQVLTDVGDDQLYTGARQTCTYMSTLDAERS